MDESSAGTSEDLARRGLRYTKEQFDAVLNQPEDYVREKPAQSLLYAFVAGFVLNRLPHRPSSRRGVSPLCARLEAGDSHLRGDQIYQAAQEEE